MDQKEREKRLAYAKGQFEIAKAYAMYWQAMAVTGAAKLRQTQQGREATEEERAKGMVMGYRDHTDEEKTANALQTMTRHIQRMDELNDVINELMGD